MVSRREKQFALLTALGLMLGLGFQNCSPLHNGNMTMSSSAAALMASPTSIAAFQASLYPVLQTNCASCHGASQQPLFAVADVAQSHDTLLSLGFIDFVAPANSHIVVKARSGHQNFAASVGNDLESAIATWAGTLIAAGITLPTNNPPPPAPGPTPNPTPTPTPTPAPSANSITVFQNTLYPVIQTNCNRCHGVSQVPMFAVTDVTQSHNTVLSAGLVDFTTPANSFMVLKVRSGHQGFPSSLADSLQTEITNWGSQGSPPAPNPSPVPTPPPLGPTYASINANILQLKCVGCHGPTIAKDGKRYDTYTNTMRTVTPYKPADSSFYENCQNGKMPPSPSPMLSAAELKAISDWINAGAPQ